MAHGLSREHQDKRLRIEFVDAEIAEVKVLIFSDCDEHEDCRGIGYDIISTNRPEHLKKGSAYWSEISEIKSFEVLGG